MEGQRRCWYPKVGLQFADGEALGTSAHKQTNDL